MEHILFTGASRKKELEDKDLIGYYACPTRALDEYIRGQICERLDIKPPKFVMIKPELNRITVFINGFHPTFISFEIL